MKISHSIDSSKQIIRCKSRLNQEGKTNLFYAFLYSYLSSADCLYDSPYLQSSILEIYI